MDGAGFALGVMMSTVGRLDPGDRSRGICGHCRARVDTVMESRDLVPPGEVEVSEGLLVEVCLTCGEIVTIPHQSAAVIAARRDRDQPPLA